MYPAQVPCYVFPVASSRSLSYGTFPLEGLLGHRLSQAAGQAYLLKAGKQCGVIYLRVNLEVLAVGQQSPYRQPSTHAQRVLRSCAMAPSALVLC